MPRDNNDRCPHCDVVFSILRVQFSLVGTRLLSVCPTCALVQADDTMPAVWRRFVRESAPAIWSPSSQRVGSVRPKLATRKALMARIGVRRFSDPDGSW
jgi:hypothetical protein